jgi:hypothetical protein
VSVHVGESEKFDNLLFDVTAALHCINDLSFGKQFNSGFIGISNLKRNTMLNLNVLIKMLNLFTYQAVK